MISLINELPNNISVTAESIKIKCLYDCYKDDDKVLFWTQDNDKAIISMTDGNMIIFNNGGNFEELKEFADVLSPACVFSDYDTLCAINRKPEERINIMLRKADIEGEVSDEFTFFDDVVTDEEWFFDMGGKTLQQKLKEI